MTRSSLEMWSPFQRWETYPLAIVLNYEWCLKCLSFWSSQGQSLKLRCTVKELAAGSLKRERAKIRMITEFSEKKHIECPCPRVHVSCAQAEKLNERAICVSYLVKGLLWRPGQTWKYSLTEAYWNSAKREPVFVREKSQTWICPTSPIQCLSSTKIPTKHLFF